MKIYKIIKTIKHESIWSTTNEDVEKYWTINPPNDAEIVPIGGDEYYDKLYAITYDTNDMSTEKLMNIMFKKLSTKETKTMCDKDKWIKDLYMNYLKNPLNDENVKKAIKRAESSAGNASSMASLAAVLNILH